MSYVDLELIERFELPLSQLRSTVNALRDPGARGKEGRVLWAGRLTSPHVLRVTEIVYPRQHNFPFEVIVEHGEIERIFDDWAKRELVPIGQVHTHPQDAWHSKEDDDYPICTQRGSLSFVIPNYARDDRRNLSDCALYKLSHKWVPVEPIEHVLVVVGDLQ